MVNKITKKIKILIIIIFAAIFIGGTVLIIYPSITNIIADSNQKAVLSQWDNSESQVTETLQDYTSVSIPIEEPAGTGIDSSANETEPNKVSAEDLFPLKISIPKIELEWIVNEGSDTKTLKKGPGHIIETVLPGEVGRCVISGHRTTYGAPFNRIDELAVGDLIYLNILNKQTFVYTVTNTIVVNPEDVYILKGSTKKELLLTTCEPEYSSAKRLVVIAELLSVESIIWH